MTTVAIDFDGTIVDSMPALRDLAMTTIQDADIHAPDVSDIVDRYDRTAGETFRTQLNTILPGKSGRWSAADRDKVADAYEEAKQEVTMTSPMFADAHLAVSRLAYHADLWVVTSTTTSLIRRRLDAGSMWRRFNGCLGPEFGGKAKKLRLLKADYFIGDTDRDADHARDAGVEFLGVRHDPSLLTSGNAFADTFEECAAHIMWGTQ